MNSKLPSCAVKLTRAVDAPVFTSQPQHNSSKHVYVHIYGFQFTTSNILHLECQATTCVNECPMTQCQDSKVFQPKLVASAQPEAHTIKAALQIVPQNANAQSKLLSYGLTSLILQHAFNIQFVAQAIQGKSPQQCIVYISISPQ